MASGDRRGRPATALVTNERLIALELKLGVAGLRRLSRHPASSPPPSPDPAGSRASILLVKRSRTPLRPMLRYIQDNITPCDVRSIRLQKPMKAALDGTNFSISNNLLVRFNRR